MVFQLASKGKRNHGQASSGNTRIPIKLNINNQIQLNQMETLEKRKYGSIQDWNLKTSNHWNQIYLFVLHNHTDVPSIDGQRFPNSTSMKLEDQITDYNFKDPITQRITPKMRIIRVVPGERSIYKDEQSEDGQKAQPISKIFTKTGDLVVEAREDQTLDFMMKSNWNGSNPARDKNKPIKFWLLDNKSGIETEMKKDQAEARAANWCYTTDFKHILRYARVLGLDTDVDGDQLRHSMRQLARRDAQKFNDGLDNKHTQRKFYVLEAVDKGLVTVDLRENTIKWQNGNKITNAPLGVHPVDHFVDQSFSSIDFEMAYRTLQGMVEPHIEKIEVKKEEPKVVAANLNGTAPTNVSSPLVIDINTPDEILLQTCISKGIITQKTSWFFYGDKKFQGKKMREALASNGTLKNELIAACQ